jgi:hypothetical protein
MILAASVPARHLKTDTHRLIRDLDRKMALKATTLNM